MEKHKTLLLDGPNRGNVLWNNSYFRSQKNLGMSRMEIQALMSQYLMKCNLPIKQENLINERSSVLNPEKRNSANKILNSIICTHHRSLVGKGGPSSSERRQRGQAFVPGEARALSKMRAQWVHIWRFAICCSNKKFCKKREKYHMVSRKKNEIMPLKY